MSRQFPAGSRDKDGGALAMKVYGHLRDQYSAGMAKLVKIQPTAVNKTTAI